MGSIAISRALRDRSLRVRAAAIETIANEQVIELFDEVNKLLSDPSEVVRVGAVEAIGNIKEASGWHYNDLYSRLTDHRMMVRIVTIEALTQINDRRAIPNIKARLFDASPLVRAFAAIGLAELKCKVSNCNCPMP
jgi:HEAT repeat protein